STVSDTTLRLFVHPLFFLHATPPSEIYSLSLHDALPISGIFAVRVRGLGDAPRLGVASLGVRPTVKAGARPLLEVFVFDKGPRRSEEHTSELQSRGHLVCRLLLEKKKKTKRPNLTESSAT